MYNPWKDSKNLKNRSGFGCLMPKNTIMVFCAHPDDEIIGMGGSIARYADEGKDIITVIFSYGEKSHLWLKEHHTVRMRTKECRKAAGIVGIRETIFLGFRDTRLSKEVKTREAFEKVENIIRKYRPAKIFTHSIDDIIYPDHKAVHNLVVKVTEEVGYKGELYSFSIWNPILVRKRNRPKLVVDISGTFDRKKKALGCFKSQKLALAQLLPGIYSKAVIHGQKAGVKYAEVFYKIR
ncbi:hypothetical protein GF351_00705 [Candidatus Woesearchaeota archaeon]|nr:hypothetical protein [Candidatus Woesearchaeota archaeon]